MTSPFITLARPAIQSMQAYQVGKPIEEARRELGIAHFIKLASNENPRGPSPAVLAALATASQEINRYPDGNGFYLKQILAERHGVDASAITLGAGSNDILELIASAYLDGDTSAIYSQYGFLVYALATARSGAESIVVDACNFGHDLSAMAGAVKNNTRVIYIANPNNPTGTYTHHNDLVALLDAVPASVLVVLDEAYCEYINKADYPDGIALQKRYANLIITRTFSKAYGLAALRLGYAVSQPDIADLMNRIRQPFNVNQVALAAAMIALDDQDYVERSVQLNRSGMAQMIAMTSELGLPVIPSVGNFICVDFGQEAGPIYEGLLRQGVIVRPVGLYELPSFLRVTIGTEDENQHFFDATLGLTYLRLHNIEKNNDKVVKSFGLTYQHPMQIPSIFYYEDFLLSL